jgi:hypothetical protein
MRSNPGARRGARLGAVIAAASAAVLLTSTSGGAATPAPPPAAPADLFAAVHAGHPGDPLSYLPTTNRTPVQGVLDRAAAVRAAVASRSYRREVEAVLAERGGTVPATPALPAPTADDERLVAPLPAGLRQPVAGLYAAVRSAAADLGTPSLDELRGELAAIDAAFGSYPQRTLDAPAPPGLSADGVTQRRLGHADALAGVQLQPATLHAVQRDAPDALMLASALDSYLPGIAAARNQATRPAAAVTGCDMLDASPALCVGGAGDNTYTGDEMLLIDMGGNNVYDNGAGAAPFVPGGSPAAVPVSVNVDMGGGTDTYTAPQSALTSDAGANRAPLVLGQGAAVLGGLGISVNAGGNASYLATGPAPAPVVGQSDTPYAETVAQGSGLIGDGFLFDGGGSASYRVAQPSLASRSLTTVVAQGSAYSLAPGAAALIQTGGGGTSYTVDAGTYAPTVPGTMFVTAEGQGSANGEGTTALLYDDGGADTYALTAASDVPGPAYDQPINAPTFQVQGQGFADAGTAMLLEGTGQHTYSVTVAMQHQGNGLFGIGGQGASQLEGEALLQDGGGPSSYDVESTLTDVETHRIDDTCHCDHAVLGVNAGAGTFPLDGGAFDSTDVAAQGASQNGIAVLDNAGGGSFRTVATAAMNVHLDDALSAPAAPARLTVHGFNAAELVAQGAQQLGFPLEDPTDGVLINRGGQASFAVSTGAPVLATAASLHGAPPVVAAHGAFQWTAGAQGTALWSDNPYNGALGALVDTGGPGDSFSAVQDNSVITVPDSGLGHGSGGWWTPFQGAGPGAIFVATGASPSIVAHPANGICPYSPSPRGYGTWLDCSSYATADPDHQAYDFLGGFYAPGHAVGYAPNATGAMPTLTLTAPPSATDGTAIPVAVRLTDSAGAPLTGAPVHVSLQGALDTGQGFWVPPQTDTRQWLSMGEVTLTTAADGTATGSLPASLLDLAGGEPSQLRFVEYQVMATFDGGGGLYPHHVVSPLTVADGGPGSTVPDLPLVPLAPLGAGLLLLGGTLRRRRRTAAGCEPGHGRPAGAGGPS